MTSAPPQPTSTSTRPSMPQSSYMASVAWASRPVHRPKSTPRSRRARIAATVRGDTVCWLVSSVPSISQNTALMWLKVVSMGAFLGCAAVMGVFESGVHRIPTRGRASVKQKPPQRGHWPLCGGRVRGADRPNIRCFSAKSRFSSNVVTVFTALQHDPSVRVQTVAALRGPPLRPSPLPRASAARQMLPPATGRSPVGPRRRTCCQSP